MSNEKVAAAVHGAPSDVSLVHAYAVGHAHGQHREVPQMRDVICAQRWLADEKIRGVEPETTGEHTQAKLADDLYSPTQEFERLYQDFAMDAVLPKRGWTPTPTELVLAVVIVLAIIGIFTFIVAAY